MAIFAKLIQTLVERARAANARRDVRRALKETLRALNNAIPDRSSQRLEEAPKMVLELARDRDGYKEAAEDYRVRLMSARRALQERNPWPPTDLKIMYQAGGDELHAARSEEAATDMDAIDPGWRELVTSDFDELDDPDDGLY